MKRIFLRAINIGSLLLALFFGILCLSRLGLDYTPEGKHFVKESMVVYNQDAVLVYGGLAIVFGLLGLISWAITRKLKSRN